MKQNMHVFSSNMWIKFKKMHILCYKLTSNSLKKIFFCFYLSRDHLEVWSSGTWRPIQKILKLRKIHHIRMILSLITYPLSPKIKPIYQVYANVSELLPPWLLFIVIKIIFYIIFLLGTFVRNQFSEMHIMQLSL